MASSLMNLKNKQVDELAELIKKSRTLMIVSIKSLPSKQFQEIKKGLRDNAKVLVAKKNILVRAIKKVGKDSILDLEKYIKADCAFVTSDKEGYELAGILSKKKTPVFAKAGQIAEDDIEVGEGPTDLMPGPAISELGALGIQIAVEDGKIAIKSPKVVVDKGGVISEGAASMFQKLNIQPFNIGLNPVAIYDVEEEKIYTDIKIDTEGFTEELKILHGKALGFAQKISYFCKETIGYFLGKANSDGLALEKLDNGEKVGREDEKVEEIKEEGVSDEKKEESAEVKDESEEEKNE